MSELNIPDAALDAGTAAISRAVLDPCSHAAAVLRAAGPALVAAELRRLASEPLLWLTSGYRADVRSWLNGRANKLDPNGDPR